MTAPLRIRIESVSGCGERFDRDELGRRVGGELSALIAREPLPRPLPAGGTLKAPGGRIHVASNATAASVAHAIARQIHAALMSARPCR
jgi:hypothetical protein